MLNKRKNIINRLVFNQISLVLIGLLVIVLISVPLAKNISKRYHINKEIQELEREIEDRERKNLSLSKLMTYFESDQFTEEQSRLNLGLKREGEEVIIVEGVTSGTSTESLSETYDNHNSQIYTILGSKETKPKKSMGNHKKWWRYFFNSHNL